MVDIIRLKGGGEGERKRERETDRNHLAVKYFKIPWSRKILHIRSWKFPLGREILNNHIQIQFDGSLRDEFKIRSLFPVPEQREHRAGSGIPLRENCWTRRLSTFPPVIRVAGLSHIITRNQCYGKIWNIRIFYATIIKI
jgi:hypothetical protein